MISQYDKIAAWFDAHRSRKFFEKKYLEQISSSLDPHAKILDLGCGMGEPIFKFLVEKRFDVTGLDGSAKLLELARERFPAHRFIHQDIRNLKLSEKYDAIIAWHVLFHLKPNEQRDVFQLIKQHLASNGVFLFTTGFEAGELWSENEGENLYHASLSIDQYKLAHKIEDKVKDFIRVTSFF